MDLPALPYADTPNSGPTVFVLDFDYVRPPLTANQRHHWREKAAITADVRTAARFLARRIPYLERCEVSLRWYVSDARRRDADNIVPTLKAMCDGLVDAGVVSDDTPNLMVKNMPIIERSHTARMTLTVARLAPEVPAA